MRDSRQLCQRTRSGSRSHASHASRVTSAASFSVSVVIPLTISLGISFAVFAVLGIIGFVSVLLAVFTFSLFFLSRIGSTAVSFLFRQVLRVNVGIVLLKTFPAGVHQVVDLFC